MAKRWKLSTVKELFSSRGCELLETEYINTGTKMRYIATCGHEHSISLDNFRAGKGDLCKKCRYEDIAGKESVPRSKVIQAFEARFLKYGYLFVFNLKTSYRVKQRMFSQ